MRHERARGLPLPVYTPVVPLMPESMVPAPGDDDPSRSPRLRSRTHRRRLEKRAERNPGHDADEFVAPAPRRRRPSDPSSLSSLPVGLVIMPH
jgi:hypothetical protein